MVSYQRDITGVTSVKLSVSTAHDGMEHVKFGTRG